MSDKEYVYDGGDSDEGEAAPSPWMASANALIRRLRRTVEVGASYNEGDLDIFKHLIRQQTGTPSEQSVIRDLQALFEVVLSIAVQNARDDHARLYAIQAAFTGMGLDLRAVTMALAASRPRRAEDGDSPGAGRGYDGDSPGPGDIHRRAGHEELSAASWPSDAEKAMRPMWMEIMTYLPPHGNPLASVSKSVRDITSTTVRGVKDKLIQRLTRRMSHTNYFELMKKALVTTTTGTIRNLPIVGFVTFENGLVRRIDALVEPMDVRNVELDALAPALNLSINGEIAADPYPRADPFTLYDDISTGTNVYNTYNRSFVDSRKQGPALSIVWCPHAPFSADSWANKRRDDDIRASFGDRERMPDDVLGLIRSYGQTPKITLEHWISSGAASGPGATVYDVRESILYPKVYMDDIRQQLYAAGNANDMHGVTTLTRQDVYPLSADCVVAELPHASIKVLLEIFTHLRGAAVLKQRFTETLATFTAARYKPGIVALWRLSPEKHAEANEFIERKGFSHGSYNIRELLERVKPLGFSPDDYAWLRVRESYLGSVPASRLEMPASRLETHPPRRPTVRDDSVFATSTINTTNPSIRGGRQRRLGVARFLERR